MKPEMANRHDREVLKGDPEHERESEVRVDDQVRSDPVTGGRIAALEMKFQPSPTMPGTPISEARCALAGPATIWIATRAAS